MLALAAPSTSTNWAGYIAEGGGYTGVGASWSVPASTSGDSFSGNATWVGIGGSSSADLIQAGTEAITSGAITRYEAWYERLPGVQQKVPLAIHAGDAVTVSLAEESPGLWLLTFANSTEGTAYSAELPYDSSHSSADWVEEAPLAQSSRGSRLLPLDAFGSVTFTNAYAIQDGNRVTPSEAGAYPLAMAQGRVALATPSALSGDSFSVSRASGTALLGANEPSAPAIPAAPVQVYQRSSPHAYRIVIIWGP